MTRAQRGVYVIDAYVQALNAAGTTRAQALQPAAATRTSVGAIEMLKQITVGPAIP